MERQDPKLYPEWHKGAGKDNKTRPSSQLGECGLSLISRNGLSGTSCSRDDLRPSGSNRGSISLHRSVSSNFSSNCNMYNSSRPRAYSSFGRGHHGRDAKTIVEICEPDRWSLSSDHTKLRRSQSMIPERQVELWPEGSRKDLNDGVNSWGRRIGGEREDVTSVSYDSRQWEEMPINAGGSRLGPSFALQTAMSEGSVALNRTRSLTLAEVVSKPPAIIPNLPLTSGGSQRTEESELIQYGKLIPLISKPKNSAFNAPDNSKLKAAKGGGSSAQPKVGQQSTFARHDTSKTGNIEIFNRDRDANVLSPLNNFNKLKADNSKGSQSRREFLNSFRKGASRNSTASTDSSNSETSSSERDNKNCEELESSIYCNVVDKPNEEEAAFVDPPDEEEATFLRSLGWDENGSEEPLTAEEISDFLKKNERKLSTKLYQITVKALDQTMKIDLF